MITDAQALAHQARRPAADPLLPAPDPPEDIAGDQPAGATAGRQDPPALASRCAASGSPTPATARTAPSCRRRSTTRSRPTTDPGAPDRAAGRATTTSRCSRTCFPTLTATRREPPPPSIVPTRPGKGACEVVVFTQDPNASLGALPLWHLELLLEVWADRYARAGRARRRPLRVAVREPRGRGRGDAAPSARPDLRLSVRAADPGARAGAAASAPGSQHGRGLLEDLIARGAARTAGGCSTRGEHAVALCRSAPATPTRSGSRRAGRAPLGRRPRCRGARRLRARAEDGAAEVRRAVAAALSLHHGLPSGADRRAAPSGGAPAHRALPAYRMPGRLKYLAGSEIGAGVFTADTLPEEKAAELQAVEVDRLNRDRSSDLFGRGAGGAAPTRPGG